MVRFQQFPANFGVEPREPDMGGCSQVLERQIDNHSPAPGGCFFMQPLSPFDRNCGRILYSKCFISRAMAEEEAAHIGDAAVLSFNPLLIGAAAWKASTQPPR